MGTPPIYCDAYEAIVLKDQDGHCSRLFVDDEGGLRHVVVNVPDQYFGRAMELY